jgi:hypothetical protein
VSPSQGKLYAVLTRKQYEPQYSFVVDNMLALLFGVISLLYATVGQAGGTSFIALMALASFSPNEMRPTALLLNVVAASYSTWFFNRGSLVDWGSLFRS